jgi:D-alanine-D-alanine ligase
MRRRVTILYDRIEDDVYERASAAGSNTEELVPVHVALGEALEGRGHRVAKIAATRDMRTLASRLRADTSDVIFNVCDGLEGETKASTDVVALLELLDRPFTGSGSTAMRLAGDKRVAKEIFIANGITTPRYVVVPVGEALLAAPELDFPLIVKPVDEDASVGISDHSVVHGLRDLRERVTAIHRELATGALVEEFIPGREIYATLLGNEHPVVLPLLEWPMKTLYAIGSWEAKWISEHENYQKCADVFATGLPGWTVARIRREAVVAFRALGLAGYARMDIRVALDGTPYFLEANPNPFFDASAEVAMAARSVGLDYTALAERLLDFALERRSRVREAA